MKTLIFATTNEGKTKELKQYLPDWIIKTIKDFPDAIDVEETGLTYRENAQLKAETLYKQLGIPVVAEDAGIDIDLFKNLYLNQVPHKKNTDVAFPGIYSARYSSMVFNDPKLDHNDKANNELVLAEFENMEITKGPQNREAIYRSTMCLFNEHGPHFFEGEMKGQIGFEEKGGNGFAYDYLFLPYLVDGTLSSKTYAMMSNKEKNKYSHRVKSVKKLLKFIKKDKLK